VHLEKYLKFTRLQNTGFIVHVRTKHYNNRCLQVLCRPCRPYNQSFDYCS